MKQGTIQHFVEWASRLTLDTGEQWKVEPWQRKIVADILAGKATTWIVIPEGNGKTTLMAGLALYHLDPEGWGIRRPWVVVAAATRDQALWLYQQASGMVRDSESMRDRFVCQEGFRRIKLPEDSDEDPRGRIQVWAADDKNADGAIFTLGIIDELHNHRDLRLYRRWRGKLQKRGGQLVAISTAGEPGSEFEETRSRIRREAKQVKSGGAHLRAEAEDIILHDWAVRDRNLAENMREVKRANPRRDITVAALRRKRHDLTMTAEHWLRFTCDIATRIEGSAVLPEDWDACYEENLVTDPHVRCWGGMDLAFTQDCTGLVVIAWEAHDRRPIVWTRILTPPVDEEDIVSALVEAQQAYQPVGWAYDPSRSGAQMAQLLDKGKHPDQEGTTFNFIEHSQANTPMALAAARLDEAINGRWIRHDGDPELRRHVLNATKKEMGGGRWRYERPLQTNGARPGNAGGARLPIDALTALAMAHSVAVAENDQPKKEPLVAYSRS